MRIHSHLAVLVALLTLALAAQVGARPNVVVSIHPLYDLVGQIAGDDATLTRILPPGASPHTFDPTPRDVARIAAADLIVMNGGLDLWLATLVQASGSRATVLEIISLPAVRATLLADFPDLLPADLAQALGFNAHVWLDPLTMIAAIPALAAALTAVAPDAAARFDARAAALTADLTALHAELSDILAGVARAPFVPFHDAWPYFAARYDLDLIIEIEPFPGREPSPHYLRNALAAIRAAGVRVIFTEPQLMRRPAEVVAAEAGVALAEIDPLGGSRGRERYQELLRANALALRDALTPP
jgi:zinc transport system substrate-binding protein